MNNIFSRKASSLVHIYVSSSSSFHFYVYFCFHGQLSVVCKLSVGWRLDWNGFSWKKVWTHAGYKFWERPWNRQMKKIRKSHQQKCWQKKNQFFFFADIFTLVLEYILLEYLTKKSSNVSIVFFCHRII